MVEKNTLLTPETRVDDAKKCLKKDKPPHSPRENHLFSCRQRLETIASTHNIDAKLNPVEHDTLLQRSAMRHQDLLQRQQANLEQIIAIAYQLCQDKTAGLPDNDWLYRFFEMAKNIHGEGMQQLWANILKQEIIKPGSTALKALSILETMTHREAQALQRACALCTTFGKDGSNKVIIGFSQPENGIRRYFKPFITEHLSLGHYKLPFTDLLMLMDLGLILRTELESGPFDCATPFPLNGQGNTLMLTSFRNGSRLCYYRFSPTGNDLTKFVGKKSHPEYFEALLALLSQAFEINSETNVNITV